MTARAYPLPRPEGDDQRFTIGLHLDVAKVLEAHGFPKPSGVDLVELGQALFRFLYAAEGQPDAGAEPDGRPLTLDEYRSALAHWERKAAEAQASDDQAALAYRTQGIEVLRRRVERDEATVQRGDYPHPLPA